MVKVTFFPVFVGKYKFTFSVSYLQFCISPPGMKKKKGSLTSRANIFVVVYSTSLNLGKFHFLKKQNCLSISILHLSFECKSVISFPQSCCLYSCHVSWRVCVSNQRMPLKGHDDGSYCRWENYISVLLR